MRPVHIAALVSSLMLEACAAAPSHEPAVRFSKPGATQGQYMLDRYACYQQSALPRAGAYVNPYAGANSGLVHSRGRWLACMDRRGYMLDSNGVLFPPPRAEIYFQEP